MNFVQPIRDRDQLAELEKFLRTGSERNWLLFVTGINSGLRISDLLTLRVRDVGGTHIDIKEKKTGKVKRFLINQRLRRALDSYTRGKDPRVHLFRSRQGTNKPLGRSAAYKLLRKAADTVGLVNIGTHTLRKTFGYHMYQKTKDVVTLMQLFNHSHPSTTLRYIGVNQDVQDAQMRDFSL